MVQPDMVHTPLSSLLPGCSPASAPACIALIGGGGKTTTMMALADELILQQQPVILTTTTKIWPPAGVPVVMVGANPDVLPAVQQLLIESGVVGLGHSFTDRGKLTGVSPELLGAILARRLATVVVEADGAAGRPLKVHGPGEPVIPGCATHTVVLAGVDAYAAQADDRAVHRIEEFRQSRRESAGSRISAGEIARALQAAARYSPPSAHVTFVLNKVDSPERRDAARRITDELRTLSPEHQVIWTAWGAPIERALAGAAG